ncbi:MAG: DNA-processing protein DprA [Oscillospiraceae bacterium]|nr:DNA-processing protein DprA [Oscillospiraceae bacterium]
MSQNRNAILALCSPLCREDGPAPLRPKEYYDIVTLLSQVGKHPADLFAFTEQDFSELFCWGPQQLSRIISLLRRWEAQERALCSYEAMDLGVITCEEEGFPLLLAQKLGKHCPPLFCYAGNLALTKHSFTGYVGSRVVEQRDLDFTVSAVRKSLSQGYGIVSGGAVGVDTIARREALLRGGVCVEYIATSLAAKRGDADLLPSIKAGKLLLLSATSPEADFHPAYALMRNRYIYAQSEGTVAVRADLCKGGTRAGALENLKHGWCAPLCWDHPYPGNQALISQGAIPIAEHWDGQIPLWEPQKATEEVYEQLLLYDTE